MVAARLETTPIGGWRVLSASGVLDFAIAENVRRALWDLVGTGVVAVVDLTGVTLLDCRCIAVLVQAARHAESAGVELRVVGARGRVHRVLEITGGAAQLGVGNPGSCAAGGGRVHDVALETLEAVLAARAVLPPGDVRRHVLRDLAAGLGLPLADRLAGRYRHMGQSIDDLSQVAAFGLLQAIDRYDPGRGERFVSFALPTILGELRRHFRDHAWGIHVPRRLQELRLSINHATDAMTQRLHRAPTVGELAEHLDASCEEVREAMVAAQGYLPASLSQPVGIDGSTELSDMIGASDPNLDHLEQRESVKRLLLTLPDREKRVLCYRFFGNMTQAQVAEALGISQMHVSRLQSRALGRLRGGLFAQG